MVIVHFAGKRPDFSQQLVGKLNQIRFPACPPKLENNMARVDSPRILLEDRSSTYITHYIPSLHLASATEDPVKDSWAVKDKLIIEY